MEFLHNINAMLVNTLGPMGPVLALGGLGVVLIIAALPTMLQKQANPYDKLKAQKQGTQPAAKGPVLRASGK